MDLFKWISLVCALGPNFQTCSTLIFIPILAVGTSFLLPGSVTEWHQFPFGRLEVKHKKNQGDFTVRDVSAGKPNIDGLKDDVPLFKGRMYVGSHVDSLGSTVYFYAGKVTWQWKMDHVKMYFLLNQLVM